MDVVVDEHLEPAVVERAGGNRKAYLSRTSSVALAGAASARIAPVAAATAVMVVRRLIVMPLH